MRSNITVVKIGLVAGFLIAVMVAFMAPWRSAQAQSATALPTAVPSQAVTEVGYDNPVLGTITDDAPQQGWTLNVPYRDRIAISVDRANKTLVPNFDLLDPDGKVVQHADHDATAAHAGIPSIKLDRAGTYTILIGRDKGKDGKTVGNFILLVSLLGTGPESPDLYKRSSEPIGPTKLHRGEITNALWLNVHGWVPLSSDHVQFTLTRQSGTLEANLVLVGPNNKELAHAEPDSTGAKTVLDYTIPAPGEYEIRVARVGNENGGTTGKYMLVETVLGLGADSPTFTLVQGIAELDKPLKGTLAGRQWQNMISFTADSAMTISIVMTRDSGNLIPLLTLSDANHKTLATAPADDTWATATISNFQLPTAGQYYITAGRADGAAGLTVGDYEFTVSQTNR